MTKEDEVWKDIPNYEGYYQASSLGRIRSLDRYIDCIVCNQTNIQTPTKKFAKGKILKAAKDKNGYYKLNLNKDGKVKHYRVCRLILLTFHPTNDKSLQVNHKDENIQNDCIENLEWCTCQYNQNYGTRNKKIAKSRMRKVYQYDLKGNYIAEFESVNSAAESVKSRFSNISSACSGKQKTCKGYIWKYEKI